MPENVISTNEVNPKGIMLYTPTKHIPIGELVLTEDGRPGLRLKRTGQDKVEIVPIEYLISEAYRSTNDREAPNV